MAQSQELRKKDSREQDASVLSTIETGCEENVEVIEGIMDKYSIAPEDQKRLTIEYQEMFAGPIPPPSMIAKYEEAVPGLAQQIVDMAKIEQNHRHTVEDKITDAKVLSANTANRYVLEGMNLKKITLIGSFAISVILIILMGICILLEKNTGAVITLIGALGAFITSIVYGKQKDVKVEEIEEQSIDENSSEDEET